MTTTVQTADLTLETPTVGLDTIHDHPANPRREAVAGEEMVDSIRASGVLEPLLVAPAVDGDGWTLIDGHRRKNGATKAGVTRVPITPRYDLVTEAQQIEAMVITGLQKQLLTPVEEAAAYEQLELLGMDDAAVAAATGFSVRRVRDRKRLNALSAEARDAVHDGQASLADVAALEEFADHPAALADLEATLGTPEFRSKVHHTRSRLARDAENRAAIEAWTALGAVRITSVPGGAGTVVEVDAETGKVIDFKPAAQHDRARVLRVLPGDLQDPAEHDGCLAWSLADYDYATATAYCIKPDRHPELTQQTPAEREPSQWEQQRAAREAEQARHEAADAARREWLTDHFAALFPTKSHQPLAAFARPFLTAEDDPHTVPAPTETPTRVLRRYAAWMTEQTAGYFREAPWAESRPEILPRLALWDWLTAAGYQLTEVDVEIRTRLESRLADLADEQVAS